MRSGTIKDICVVEPDLAMLRNFVRFLMRKDAHTKFVNGARYYDKCVYGPKDAYRRSITPADYLMNAFTWRKTQYGFSLWDDLNDEWIEYLRKTDGLCERLTD